MQYTAAYRSPLGEVLLAADEAGLTGLWFRGQKYFAPGLDDAKREESLPVFEETRRWLDRYFSGREPDFMPPLHPLGTPFQLEVWEILRAIPYGGTMTYGEIGAETARRQGRARMSAQAVGGAVGHNKISILIPCHRVVGAGGSLTGYAGGVEKKAALLQLEGGMQDRFFIPKHGTAL